MQALSVKDLRFRYHRGADKLFSGITHRFTPGAVTGVTGSSGRGKSTLLYVIGLLLSPSSGDVIFDGATVSQAKDPVRATIRAQQIGFMFQDSELDPTRTILDSVLEPTLYAGIPRDESLPHALKLLKRFGLAERATHRPGQISGGQAQRVALCRALVNRPPIILADEPTGNLDRDNATLVLAELTSKAHKHGDTVIIASHDPFVLDAVDEVVAL